MNDTYHTVVVGGGCLGSACALSTARKLSGDEKVCVIEQAIVGAGLSSRHSGIVRAANANSMAARMARKSIDMWRGIEELWGVSVPYKVAGAVWIAAHGGGADDKWNALEQSMRREGIEFRGITLDEAQAITESVVEFKNSERMYHEPNVLLFNPAEVRAAFARGFEKYGVYLRENTRVLDINFESNGETLAVHTTAGDINCTRVINASGAWAARLFATGNTPVNIPVALQPVYVTNWLTSPRDLPEDYPVIADFCNLAYFRRWDDGALHMHHPRRRDRQSISAAFVRAAVGEHPDTIFDSGNYTAAAHQLSDFKALLAKRMPSLSNALYAGGFNSYFDVTPDLQFILGRDQTYPSLIHCLGGGQAFKYTPVLGEIVSDLAVHDSLQDDEIDIKPFSIERFTREAALPTPQQELSHTL